MPKKRRSIIIDLNYFQPFVDTEKLLKPGMLRRDINSFFVKLWFYSKKGDILPGNKMKCLCGSVRHISAFEFDHIDNTGGESGVDICELVGWKVGRGIGGTRLLQALLILGQEYIDKFLLEVQLICASCHAEKSYFEAKFARDANKKHRESRTSIQQIKICSNEPNTKKTSASTISEIRSAVLNTMEVTTSLSLTKQGSLPLFPEDKELKEIILTEQQISHSSMI